MQTSLISRRLLLQSLSAVGGVFTFGKKLPALDLNQEVKKTQSRLGDPIRVSDRDGVVETESGKVRGERRKGVYIYRGIPYGASTAGANRFMRPQTRVRWSGVRSTLAYGPVCPFPPRAEWANDESAFLNQWQDGQPGEDCLRVNVWTLGPGDNRKRPVMVWIHGGGYGWGSGQELLSYEGENLCHRGDVVVVTLNHRVNAFGFLNLSQLDERYRDSGNLGMIDLVFALQWVRDNIGNFGGDHSNVMIFGQSGGGGKISTLMMMPSARGLFHKAAVQSGSLLSSKSPEDSFVLAEAVLKELDISKGNIESLHTISTDRLLTSSIRAQRSLLTQATHRTAIGPDFRALLDVSSWAPIADGDIISGQVWDPTLYAEIPLLVGSTLNEFITGADKPGAFSMTENQLREKLSSVYGEKTDSIVAAYRASHPTSNPFQLFSIIASQSVRTMAVKQAQIKAALQKAPVYLYWFAWQSPVLDGRAMAYHSLDLPFCFDNVDRCETSTGGSDRAHALAAQMSEAWIRFARHGDPNHSELPTWEPVTADAAKTMVFDDTCRMEHDPDRAERELTA